MKTMTVSHVVCRIENVYFSSGQYSRRFLKGEGCREEAAIAWIADTLSAERGARQFDLRPWIRHTTSWCKPVRSIKEYRSRTQGAEGERKSAEPNISGCSMNRNEI